MKRICLFLAIALFVHLQGDLSLAETRTWTSSDGKTQLEADFVRVEAGFAYLQPENGRMVKVALDKLSTADREFLQSLQAKPGPAEEADAKESEPSSGRLSVPDKEARKASSKLLKELYGKKLSQAKTQEQKRAVAIEMFKQAEEVGDDAPVDQYVLLTTAARVAAASGDAELVIQIESHLVGHYKTDILQTMLELLVRCEKSLSGTKQREAYVHAVLPIIDENLQRHRYEAAVALANAVRSAASKSQNHDLLKTSAAQLARTRNLLKRHKEYEAALAVLKNDPKSPAANLTVGKYQCLVLIDWEEGLSHLKLGSDAAYQQIAELELEEPEETEDQLKLGDQWWALSQRETSADLKFALKSRAARWYEKSFPQLAGLAKAKVKGRLDQFAKLDSAADGPTVTPDRDRVEKSEDDDAIPFIEDGMKREAVGLLTKISDSLRGEKFQETGPKNAILVGLKVSTREAFGVNCVASIQPIFQASNGKLMLGELRGVENDDLQVAIAKKGYAVGGINARAGLVLNGIEIVFLKKKRGRLNPNDGYRSAWLGSNSGGRQLTHSGGGRPITGIYGAGDQKLMHGIGLILKP